MGHWRDFDGFSDVVCRGPPEADMNALLSMSVGGEDVGFSKAANES